MKKKLVIICVAFLLITLAAITVEAKPNKSKMLVKKADITGDGVKDEVTLKEYSIRRHGNNSKKTVISLKLSTGKTQEINLRNGQNPKMVLVDFNNDGVKEIFVRFAKGGTIEHQLFSFKDSIFKEWSVPELPTIQGQFSNGYKAKITIQETKMYYMLKLHSRKENYDSLGIYRNGKVNEPTELVIRPYGGFNQTQVHENEMGLKGVQIISGIGKTDTLAFVESYYSWINGHWTLQKAKVLEVNHH
ncbi:MAG: hypothetical protein K0S25_1905 [Bacillus sp. (in: firmicutes)]|nr:hypothetical protein [Bacillus sp. (in: firmicutes)]